MGKSVRDFLHVVGNHDNRRGIRIQCQVPEVAHEVLTAAQVHAGGGLIQDEQLRVGHERTGEDDALLLTFGERAPSPLC